MIRIRALVVAVILAVLSREVFSGENSGGSSPLNIQQRSVRAVEIDRNSLLSPKTFRLPVPNFDQGTFRIAQPSEVPALKPEISKPVELNPEGSATRPIFGITLGTYLRQNQNLRQAATLIADPRFSYLEPIQQELLRAEYNGLAAERDGMLPKADGLDAQDAAFAQEREALDKEKAALQAERNEYNRQVLYHNSICNPAPDEPTWQWCLQDETRLKKWQADLLRRIDVFNQKVVDYNKRYEAFASHWNIFVATINAWENRVKDLIQRLLKALSQVTGTCDAAKFGELRDRYDKACRKLKSCDSAMGCAELATNMKNNGKCADAAKEINDTCFGGANDTEYSKKQEEASAEKAKCWALFAGKCGGWDPDTGKCTQTQHAILQAHVRATCDRPRSCKNVPFMDCVTLREYLTRNEECYDARHAINVICYEGGDQTHQDEEHEAQELAAECQKRIGAECVPPSSNNR